MVDSGINPGFGADYCCFFTAGHNVTQTYTGTGLSSVNTLSFSIPIAYNSLSSGSSVDFNVLLNGIVIGSTSWSSSQGIGTDNFNASFADIVGAGGNYTVEILETNTVTAGDGSIGLDYGSLTLGQTAAATPEPSTMGLLATSLVSLGLVRRRRRTA